MNKLFRAFLGALALMVLAPSAFAQTTIGPIIIAANGDDGFEDSSGTGNSTGNQVGPVDQSNEWAYFRFTGITIPSGATITSAYITFGFDSSGQDEPDLTIFGVDASNPSAPSWGGSTPISGLTPTTATVDWASTNLGSGNAPPVSDFNTPSLVTIVQELVDSYSYSSSAMAFFTRLRTGATADGSRDFSVIGLDNATYGAASAARLTITYTTGGGGDTRKGRTLMLGVGQ